MATLKRKSAEEQQKQRKKRESEGAVRLLKPGHGGFYRFLDIILSRGETDQGEKMS